MLNSVWIVNVRVNRGVSLNQTILCSLWIDEIDYDSRHNDVSNCVHVIGFDYGDVCVSCVKANDSYSCTDFHVLNSSWSNTHRNGLLNHHGDGDMIHVCRTYARNGSKNATDGLGHRFVENDGTFRCFCSHTKFKPNSRSNLQKEPEMSCILENNAIALTIKKSIQNSHFKKLAPFHVYKIFQ